MKSFLGGKIIDIDPKCFRPATKVDITDDDFYPCPGDIQKFVDDNFLDLI